MKKKGLLIAAAALALVQIAGCGKTDNNKDTTKAEASKEPQATENSQIASEDEMVQPEDVVEEGMVPITGDQVKDGTYDIQVDSSSSMFKISSCKLIVEEGKMNAVMTMGGTGYLKLFMGTGKDAVEASEDEYIPYEETETKEHTFTVPVEALDKGIDCTAFSKNKEKWYDRVLVFRADSLPAEAFEEGVFTTAESLNLEDGAYKADVVLEGGSGRASIESPAKITIADGKMTVVIVWSSSNYDYMKVGEQKYEPVNTEGNSTFEIPVEVFDRKVSVIADTTAMSEPHEISYTLCIDSATIEKAE